MRAGYWIVGALLSVGLLATRVGADDAVELEAPAAVKPMITLVNLHLQHTLPEDAFDELARQGGVKFTTNGIWDQPGMQTENDIDMTDRPFWSAVNEVCGLWKVAPQPVPGNFQNYRQREIQLSSDPDTEQKSKFPVVESAGCLVQAIQTTRQQTVEYAAPQHSVDTCIVWLKLFVDPAIRMQNLGQTVRIDHAVDDAGNSMVNGPNGSLVGTGWERSMIYDCTVPLKYTNSPGKKIADLKCTISLHAIDATGSLTVDNPLEAGEVSKNFADTTVTFHSLKKTVEGTYELKIAMTPPQPPAAPGVPGRGNIISPFRLLRTAQLLDSKNRAYTPARLGMAGRGKDGLAEYTVGYRLGGRSSDLPEGDPVKWVFELPTKTHSIDLPVEFKDLALP